jgi:hypothetical protein
MSKPTLTVTADFTEDFNRVIRKFKRDAVLVGIPEEKAERKKDGEEDAPINNAALLAINNFGSPVNNIPARPVMEIGIRAAQREIAEAFRKGAVDALSQGFAALFIAYNRAGIIASVSIKKAINAQEGFDPPSDATLKAREARGFKGTKALIVTGQMRNAITYVVKGEE